MRASSSTHGVIPMPKLLIRIDGASVKVCHFMGLRSEGKQCSRI